VYDQEFNTINFGKIHVSFVVSNELMRILLIEDDLNLGVSLKSSLVAERYLVDWVQTSEAAHFAVAKANFDLVILDIGLPDASGLNFLTTLRQEQAADLLIPVLIVTAMDSLRDRVTGLDAGADDYLVKPFMLDELLARVRALIRRRSGAASNLVQHGRLKLDLVARKALVEGLVIDFSDREFAVLELLVLRAGRPVNKEQIQSSLESMEANITTNAIEVYIHRVRKKLEPIGINVKTLRGLGYCLDRSVV
jgi:two-component system, OmpR family, response regulator